MGVGHRLLATRSSTRPSGGQPCSGLLSRVTTVVPVVLSIGWLRAGRARVVPARPRKAYASAHLDHGHRPRRSHVHRSSQRAVHHPCPNRYLAHRSGSLERRVPDQTHDDCDSEGPVHRLRGHDRRRAGHRRFERSRCRPYRQRRHERADPRRSPALGGLLRRRPLSRDHVRVNGNRAARRPAIPGRRRPHDQGDDPRDRPRVGRRRLGARPVGQRPDRAQRPRCDRPQGLRSDLADAARIGRFHARRRG